MAGVATTWLSTHHRHVSAACSAGYEFGRFFRFIPVLFLCFDDLLRASPIWCFNISAFVQVSRLGDELREKENTILRHRLGPDWTPGLEESIKVYIMCISGASQSKPQCYVFLFVLVASWFLFDKDERSKVIYLFNNFPRGLWGLFCFTFFVFSFVTIPVKA